MPGNPLYVTASSSGPGKWIGVDTGVTPQDLAWQLIFTSTLATVANLEATIDNPFSYGSSIAGSGAGLAVAPSSQSPWPIVLATYSSTTQGQTPALLTLNGGLLAGSSIGASSGFGGPIYAWRINMTSSNLTTYVTFLQAGKKQ
jgi:hypothetical protein